MSPKRVTLNQKQIQILNILRNQAFLKPEDIAEQLGNSITAQEVGNELDFLRKSGILIKFKALINWDKITNNRVKALIEVKVTPQRGYGFDRIAKRIYNFPEVTSCYLVSGAYDLLVQLEGENLQEVAHFVAEKLSTLDSVMSTVTHFLLKKYKEDGDILTGESENDDRMAILP